MIAFNRPVDAEAATSVTEAFYEGVIAPDFDAESRKLLAKKKKLRVLATGDLTKARRGGFDIRRVNGGMLLQDWDRAGKPVREAETVTERAPTEAEWKALEFSWAVVRHVKSNAIVFATSQQTVGIGAGQMSRVDSVKLAEMKANLPIKGCVMASDDFFPFRDGIDAAVSAGITAVIQPGGSIRDKVIIQAVDEQQVAMILTGMRHFRH